jgi:hypothetical protein
LAHADPLYQHLIVTAERKFWRCVESAEQPRLLGMEPPKARLEAVRVVDMTASDAWAEFAAVSRAPGRRISSMSRPRAYCRRMPRRRPGMAFGPSARKPEPSVLISQLRSWAMQRSSSSIAALATALAKAQIELTNPEKSLVGAIEPQRGEGDSVMRRYPAGLRLCARLWGSMRSRPCRPRRSIKRPGS